MTDDRLVAIVSGLTLRGFREYKKFWIPDLDEELMLEIEKQLYLKYGSYPVAALRKRDGKTVGRVGYEYSFHIKRLIQLKNICKAVVKDVKPITKRGEEILCDYVIEGKNTQDTRLVLSQFLHGISCENLKFYKAVMKVKLENNWVSGQALYEALKPPAVKTSKSDENIPDEIGVDPETRQLYEKAIREGVEVDKSVRIMLIGCFNQGKTTLQKRLLGEPFDTIESTDGIDVTKFTSGKTGRWLRQDSLTQDRTSARLAAVVKTMDIINNNSDVDQSALNKMDKIDETEIMKIKPEHVSSFWRELKKKQEIQKRVNIV